MTTRRKTVAIIFAILFLCYYQEWFLVLIVNSTTEIGHRLLGSVQIQSSGGTDTKLLIDQDQADKNSLSLLSVSGSVKVGLPHHPLQLSSINPSSTSSLFSTSDNDSVNSNSANVQQQQQQSDADRLAKSKSKSPASSLDVPAIPATARSFVLGGPGPNRKKAEKDKKLTKVQQLASEVQAQLAQLQYFDDASSSATTDYNNEAVLLKSFCNRPRITCGPPIDCEFGCQVHHFITCLLIAYNSNRTLIPDFTSWPYSDVHWRSIFKPILGNIDLFLLKNSTQPNCPEDENNNNNFVNINNEISSVSWTKDKVEVCTRDILEYPFLNGVLPVPYELGMKLKQLGIPSPFQWWIGQFARFIMRPEREPEQKLLGLRKQFLRVQRINKIPTVGIMIRRRDKIGEKKRTSNTLDKHMTVVKKYFAKYDSLPTTPINFTRRVYLATDDAGLVLLAQKQYPKPKWDIFTLPNENSEMENLVRDIFLLRECDLVLCSFSSDVCRLVSELLETKGPGGSSHVRSLDHKYFFDVPDFKGKNKLRIILQ